MASSGQQPGGRSPAALPDSGFSFGGLRGRSNNVAIDGLDNNDEYLGSSRTELSLETIQEFQVVNAGLSAETGGASGGSINVITRVGANTLHGDAFVFAGNGALDAREPFETESAAPMLHRYRAGAAIGGAILHDRTFYYLAFEQEHSRSLEDSLISPALAGAVNRVLASGAYPFLPVRRLNPDFFPAARAETEASAKLNHQLTPRNSVMLRYAFTGNRESGDAFNTAGWTDPSARGSSFTRDQAVVGSLTSVFGAQAVGDFRFQFADRDAVLRTNDAAGPGMEIAGLVNFGPALSGATGAAPSNMTRPPIPIRAPSDVICGRPAPPCRSRPSGRRHDRRVLRHLALRESRRFHPPECRTRYARLSVGWARNMPSKTSVPSCRITGKRPAG